jgi:hypothetical protein
MSHAESGNPANILTTKGDLIGTDGTTTTRFPAGIDGQILAYDSTQSLGLLAIHTTRLVVQASDQTFTNNTLANVTNLFFPMATSTSYLVEVFLLLSSTATNADYNFGWTFPVNFTMFWAQENGDGGSANSGWTPANAGATPPVFLTESSTFNVGAVNGTHGIKLAGFARNSTTVGNLQLRAAQNTTQAGTTTKVLKDSLIRYRKLQ